MVSRQTSLKRGIVSFLGALGYISVCLQWLFVALLYFQTLYAAFPMPQPVPESAPPTPSLTVEAPSPLVLVFGAVVTVIMIGISLYAIIKVPQAIAKTGRRVVEASAEKTAPLLLKASHRPNTKRNRRHLTPRLVVLLKLFSIIIPFVLTWVAQYLITLPLEADLVMVVAYWLAAWSIGYFMLQYGALRLFKLTSLP